MPRRSTNGPIDQKDRRSNVRVAGGDNSVTDVALIEFLNDAVREGSNRTAVVGTETTNVIQDFTLPLADEDFEFTISDFAGLTDFDFELLMPDAGNPDDVSMQINGQTSNYRSQRISATNGANDTPSESGEPFIGRCGGNGAAIILGKVRFAFDRMFVVAESFTRDSASTITQSYNVMLSTVPTLGGINQIRFFTDSGTNFVQGTRVILRKIPEPISTTVTTVEDFSIPTVNLPNLSEFDFEVYGPATGNPDFLNMLINGSFAYRNQSIAASNAVAQTPFDAGYTIVGGISDFDNWLVVGQLRSAANRIMIFADGLYLDNTDAIYQAIDVTKRTSDDVGGVTTVDFETDSGTNLPVGTTLKIRPTLPIGTPAGGDIIASETLAVADSEINLTVEGLREFDVEVLIPTAGNADDISMQVNGETSNYLYQRLSATNQVLDTPDAQTEPIIGVITDIGPSTILAKARFVGDRMLVISKSFNRDAATAVKQTYNVMQRTADDLTGVNAIRIYSEFGTNFPIGTVVNIRAADPGVQLATTPTTGFTITDGTNTVEDVEVLTVTGGTVGGTTPNATLDIAGGSGGGQATLPVDIDLSGVATVGAFEISDTTSKAVAYHYGRRLKISASFVCEVVIPSTNFNVFTFVSEVLTQMGLTLDEANMAPAGINGPTYTRVLVPVGDATYIDQQGTITNTEFGTVAARFNNGTLETQWNILSKSQPFATSGDNRWGSAAAEPVVTQVDDRVVIELDIPVQENAAGGGSSGESPNSVELDMTLFAGDLSALTVNTTDSAGRFIHNGRDLKVSGTFITSGTIAAQALSFGDFVDFVLTQSGLTLDSDRFPPVGTTGTTGKTLTHPIGTLNAYDDSTGFYGVSGGITGFLHARALAGAHQAVYTAKSTGNEVSGNNERWGTANNNPFTWDGSGGDILSYEFTLPVVESSATGGSSSPGSNGIIYFEEYATSGTVSPDWDNVINPGNVVYNALTGGFDLTGGASTFESAQFTANGIIQVRCVFRMPNPLTFFDIRIRNVTQGKDATKISFQGDGNVVHYVDDFNSAVGFTGGGVFQGDDYAEAVLLLHPLVNETYSKYREIHPAHSDTFNSLGDGSAAAGYTLGDTLQIQIVAGQDCNLQEAVAFAGLTKPSR